MSDQQQQPSNKIQVSNYDKIRAMAKNEDVIKSFTAVLGSRTTAQAYISSALLAVANSSALMECTPASVMQVALRSATLRLSCDPALGQAYIVPYNDHNKGKVATLQLGYKGIKQMGLRTNKYRFINPGRLYEGQIIEQNQLTGQVVIRGQRTSDIVIGYFSYFEYFNGYSAFLYMTIEELWAHAEHYSKSYQNAIKYNRKDSLWQTDFDAMAQKTVTRLNLLRNGTLNTEDATVLAAMEDEAAQLHGDVIDTTFENIQISDEDAAKIKGPERTVAQNLADLGFEPEKKAEAPVTPPTAETAKQEPDPLDVAEAEYSESQHCFYGQIQTPDLQNMLNGMAKVKTPTDDQKRKISFAKMILAARAKGRPVMAIEPIPESQSKEDPDREPDPFTEQPEIDFGQD